MLTDIALGIATALVLLPAFASAITPIDERNEWLIDGERRRLERRMLELRDELKNAVTSARTAKTYAPTAFPSEGERPCHD